MAAIFYNPSPKHSVFKGDIAVVSAVRMQFMENFIGPNSLAIVTEVGIQNSDTIQYFMTFDDVINYFYFGKGMGQINIQGMIFSDCEGRMPGLNHFYNNVIGQYRSKQVLISIGNIVFACVISNFSTSVVTDPAYTTQFNITLNIVNHNIPSPGIPSSGCAVNPWAK